MELGLGIKENIKRQYMRMSVLMFDTTLYFDNR